MRKLTVLLGVAAVLAMTAGPVSAKGGPGEDTSRHYVRITGPGIGLPIEFGGPPGFGFYGEPNDQAAVQLDLILAATGAGGGCYGCASYYDTHAPKDLSTLGPRYLIEYYRFPCCDGEVMQALYPFAPGGPWTFTPSFQGPQATNLLGQPIQVHWFHASGRLGTRFLTLLEAHGLSKHAIVGAAGAAATTTRQPSRPWAIGLAITAVLALLTIGALASRRATVRPA